MKCGVWLPYYNCLNYHCYFIVAVAFLLSGYLLGTRCH